MNTSNTTADTAKSDLKLVVVVDQHGFSKGDLFLDDGITKLENFNFTFINFECKKDSSGNLTLNSSGSYKYISTSLLDSIRVVGISQYPSSVMINGLPFDTHNVIPVINGFELHRLRLSTNIDFVIELKF